MNPPERLVWAALRRLGDNWRRQAPIGRFVVDFANHRRRLILEIDGGVHRLPQVALRDAERDAWLRSQGYRVLRFTDREVRQALPDVVGAVNRACGWQPAEEGRCAFRLD